MYSWSVNTLWVQASRTNQHCDGACHGNRMPVTSPSNHQTPLLIPLRHRVHFKAYICPFLRSGKKFITQKQNVFSERHHLFLFGAIRFIAQVSDFTTSGLLIFKIAYT